MSTKLYSSRFFYEHIPSLRLVCDLSLSIFTVYILYSVISKGMESQMPLFHSWKRRITKAFLLLFLLFCGNPVTHKINIHITFAKPSPIKCHNMPWIIISILRTEKTTVLKE